MNNTQKLIFQAGETKGQAQEKLSNWSEKASNAAQSTKEYLQESGEQLKPKAQGALDAVKDATSFNTKN